MLISILKGEMSLIEIVMHIAAVILVILIILPFHELAHGFIAYKLGDDTAKKAGRLTFNPLHHIDYVGALCLILVGFGWADPVPVNPYNLKNPKRDMAFVALAGQILLPHWQADCSTTLLHALFLQLRQHGILL